MFMLNVIKYNSPTSEWTDSHIQRGTLRKGLLTCAPLPTALRRYVCCRAPADLKPDSMPLFISYLN